MMKVCLLAVALLLFIQLTNQAVVPIPDEVTAFSSSRAQRYYHLFFHTARMNVLRLGRKQQHALLNMGWVAPRPASAFEADGTEVPLEGNNSGEDFIFMHRMMIGRINAILATLVGNAYKVIVGWKACPAPGDKDYPVPANYEIPGQEGLVGVITLFKSDDFYWDEIKPREEALKKNSYLRSRTLGQLGSKLENEIHTFMHIRFSAENSVGYRQQNPMTPVARVDESWDVPAYDWLGDFYSAHVNPTFWKIHGWVENRVADWAKANKLDRVIFIGTWEGGPADMYTDLESVALIDETEVPVPETTSEDTSSSDDEVDTASLEEIVKLLVKVAAN
jgi:hypothetical protein